MLEASLTGEGDDGHGEEEPKEDAEAAGLTWDVVWLAAWGFGVGVLGRGGFRILLKQQLIIESLAPRIPTIHACESLNL